MNENCQRFVLLACCLVEIGVFGGVMSGWRHMAYLFKMDGVYDSLCNKTSLAEEDAPATWYEARLCQSQDNKLEFSWAVSSVCRALGCLAATRLLGCRGQGLRLTRLIANVQIFIGGLLFFYTNKRHPAFSISGAIFVNTGSGLLLCANFFMANLFPRFRCSVLGLMCGAYAFSEEIFSFFKTISPLERYPWQSMCYAWTLSSMLIVVPTFGLLTFRHRFQGRERSYSFGDVISIRRRSNGYKDHEVIVSSSGEDQQNSGAEDFFSGTKIICDEAYSRRLSGARRVDTPLLSTPYILLICWAAIVHLSLIFFEGAFHRKLAIVVTSEIEASKYVKTYDSGPQTALLVAPLCGMLLDFFISIRAKNERTIRNGSAAALFTSLVVFLLTLSHATKNLSDLRNSIHLHAVAVPLFHVVSTAIMKCWFPREEFQKLFSFNIFVSTWFCMLKYPLLKWDQENTSHATTAIVVLQMCSIVVNVWLCLPRRWLYTMVRRLYYR